MREVVLGPETDDALFARLVQAVGELGGSIKEKQWQLGGSQEIIRYEIVLPGGALEATTETFAGLSLSGDAALIAEVERRVRA